MITSIMSNSRHLVTQGGASGTYYNNSSQPMTGMLRYHSGGRVEVFDGMSWTQVSTTQSITLGPDAESAIEWALKKQREELELERLTKEHPAVKAAYENTKRAEEQLKTTIILSKDEKPTS
jgi:hypothetical protein